MKGRRGFRIAGWSVGIVVFYVAGVVATIALCFLILLVMAAVGLKL